MTLKSLLRPVISISSRQRAKRGRQRNLQHRVEPLEDRRVLVDTSKTAGEALIGMEAPHQPDTPGTPGLGLHAGCDVAPSYRRPWRVHMSRQRYATRLALSFVAILGFVS